MSDKQWIFFSIICGIVAFLFCLCSDAFAVGVVADGDCTIPMTALPGGSASDFEVEFGPVISPAKPMDSTGNVVDEIVSVGQKITPAEAVAPPAPVWRRVLLSVLWITVVMVIIMFVLKKTRRE